MLKIRFYKIILLIPLVISIFIFSQIKTQNIYLNQNLASQDSLYKYPIDFIKVSYLPKMEMIKSSQKYLLKLNTCLQNSNSDNCVIIESEMVFSSLGNCQKKGKKVLADSYDLRSSGVNINYNCKKIDRDVYANLKMLTNKI